jgi:hypothetical protein
MAEDETPVQLGRGDPSISAIDPPDTESPDKPYRLPPEEFLLPLLLRVKERIERGEDAPRRNLPTDKTAFPKALFLDTNKWIELGQVHYGRSTDQRRQAALDAIRVGVRAGALVVPITAINLGETSQRRDEGSRQRLVDLIVDLSANFSTIPSDDLEDLEIDEALRKLYFEVPPAPEARHVLIRWGARTAYSTKVTLPSHPDPRVVRAAHEVAFEPEMTALTMFEHGRDRHLWESDKEIAQRGLETLARTRAVDSNLAPAEKLRRERRSLVTARGREEGHFLKQLNRRLRAIGIPVSGFHRWLASDEQLALFLEELPSWVVPSTLMFERDRSRDALSHVNDSNDLHFLRIAIPYGNVVVTERSWAHYGNKTRLSHRYGTIILSDLGKLPTVLALEGLPTT